METQQAKYSSNYGKPSSSDGPAKPNKTSSLRDQSGKRPGGQLGRKGVNAFTQYGKRSFAANSLHQHLISFERVAELFEYLFNTPLSPDTCANIDRKLFKNLEVFENGPKAHLFCCKVLHVNKTSVCCEKKLLLIPSGTAMYEVLYFIRDLEVPFSHYLAEQDLRTGKMKQKISSCFRTFAGGKISCYPELWVSFHLSPRLGSAAKKG